nr:hypothetical protein BdHM001_14250 [Bdellovibrio sp. HM001]
MLSVSEYEFVLVGEDSEYVLGPLFRYLKNAGYKVFELDFAVTDLQAFMVQRDVSKKLIFVSSAHPILSRSLAEKYLPAFFEKYGAYVGTMELIRTLRPFLTCFIPHDLSSPWSEGGLNEQVYAPIFDLYCNPFNEYSEYSGYTKVVDTGWIKVSAGMTSSLGYKPNKRCLMVSMVEYLRWRFGERGVFEFFAPLLTPDTSVKFPRWNGMDRLERLFKENSPSQIISCEENSTEVILNHEYIISCGTSSVMKEAILLGRPVVALLSHEGVGNIEKLREDLLRIGELNIVDYSSPREIKDSDVVIRPKSSNIKAFDFNLFMSVLESSASHAS